MKYFWITAGLVAMFAIGSFGITKVVTEGIRSQTTNLDVNNANRVAQEANDKIDQILAREEVAEEKLRSVARAEALEVINNFSFDKVAAVASQVANSVGAPFNPSALVNDITKNSSRLTALESQKGVVSPVAESDIGIPITAKYDDRDLWREVNGLKSQFSEFLKLKLDITSDKLEQAQQDLLPTQIEAIEEDYRSEIRILTDQFREYRLKTDEELKRLRVEGVPIPNLKDNVRFLSTSDLREGNNLYYTDERVRAVLSNGAIPIGGLLPWAGDKAGLPIPDGFVVANGSVISDAESPINGKLTPDLTGVFIRGEAESGLAISATSRGFTTGSTPTYAAVQDGARSFLTGSSGSDTPDSNSVIWLMRIK